jgi:hypothetical protein
MDQTLDDLYGRFLNAVQFFNSRCEQSHATDAARAAFRLRILSAEEFTLWWAKVSEDEELQLRWLERFEDPEGSLTRACERISRELNQIPIRRAAA